MKGFLGFLLAFGMLVTLSDAACYFQPAIRSGEGCVHNGIRYHTGATWTKDCKSCTCYADGARCCENFSRPVGFDEKKCELLFNKETCSYSVVEKDNPSKTCPFTGMVG